MKEKEKTGVDWVDPKTFKEHIRQTSGWWGTEAPPTTWGANPVDSTLTNTAETEMTLQQKGYTDTPSEVITINNIAT
jgi:hypothetical protein